MKLVQGTLDELGTPLGEVTFVVVDLETTGGSAAASSITEIGAVKVRGGEVLGELQTLVNPGAPIPAFIAMLTGITDRMVREAPPIEAALPTFLEFARGSVLVAHNAPFDISFLKAAAAATGHPWPGFQVVDTAHLARQVLTREEAPNRKLSTLARLFRSPTTPDHRALTDARATVDVLHALLERVGAVGVHSLEELATFSSRVSTAQRRKRHLAEGLPHSPGVYVFRDARDHVLYVGTSRDIATRVRTYFTSSEQRTRMAEMVGLAERVVPVVCATTLEAQVRELRLIAEHKPRYNRRSRFPEKALWVKLTVEPFPRLSLVHAVREDGATYLGPFGSRRSAEQSVDALHEAFALRQCTRRLGRNGGGGSCVLAEMGRCNAPCLLGQSVAADYEAVVDAARAAMSADCRGVVSVLRSRIAALAATERYEQAAVVRDRLVALVRSASRVQRLSALASCPEIVAARRRDTGGWEIVLVRHGRLAGTTVSPLGADPWPYVAALRETGEVVAPPVPPTAGGTAEEAEKVLAWLETPGTRLVELTGTWSSPVHGAGSERARIDPLAAAARAVVPFDEPSGRGMSHRPVAVAG
ncbi:MAG TPA: DEDD exonuclease domain-containing protein [Actinomycetales bacterium]